MILARGPKIKSSLLMPIRSKRVRFYRTLPGQSSDMNTTLSDWYFDGVTTRVSVMPISSTWNPVGLAKGFTLVVSTMAIAATFNAVNFLIYHVLPVSVAALSLGMVNVTLTYVPVSGSTITIGRARTRLKFNWSRNPTLSKWLKI